MFDDIIELAEKAAIDAENLLLKTNKQIDDFLKTLEFDAYDYED